MRGTRGGLRACLAVWVVSVGCGTQPREPAAAGGSAGAAQTADALDVRSQALAPLPLQPPSADPRRVALGRAMYNDKRLSGDGLVACAHCHSLAYGGANGQRRSSLPSRPPVGVNVPTVFNVAYDFRFAWNGRFERLEDQVDFALNAKAAMNSTWPAVLQELAEDVALTTAFAQAYPGGLTEATLRDSLVVYVRSLVTPNARFDRYLRRELDLSADEKRGYEHFLDYGCVSCHQGVNVGGNMYQRFGVMRDYFADRGNLEPADLGRYSATKEERDRHVFRVPSLRNVALTAPYFHDGSAATLPEAIVVMGRYQLGRELAPRDVSELAAFLRTLTGELGGRAL